MLKAAKKGVLAAARATGALAVARRATRKRLRILAYHGLWTTPGFHYGDKLFMTPAQFERRMTWLKRSGYPVLDLREALTRLEDGTLPDCAVVITVDDAWVSTYTHMMPVLEALQLPATLYATTWYALRQIPIMNVALDYLLTRAGQPSEKMPTLLADIERKEPPQRTEALLAVASQLGVESESWMRERQFYLMSMQELADADRRALNVQLHTHRHKSFGIQAADFASDIARNRECLAHACGRAPETFDQFCYPSGKYNGETIEVLRGAGMKSATVCESGLNSRGCDHFQLRRFLDGGSVSQIEFESYLSGVLRHAG